MEVFCRAKFDEFAPLLGVSIDMFTFAGVNETNVETNCGFQQVVNGVPLEGAGIGVGVGKPSAGKYWGDLVTFGTGAHPGIAISTEPKLTVQDAVAVAERRFREEIPSYDSRSDAEKRILPREKVVIYPKPIQYPGGRPTGYEYHLVWIVNGFGREYSIDAHNGEIVREVQTRKESP